MRTATANMNTTEPTKSDVPCEEQGVACTRHRNRRLLTQASADMVIVVAGIDGNNRPLGHG